MKKLIIALLFILPLQLVKGQDTYAPKPEKRWIIGVQAGGSSLMASTAKKEKSMIELGIPKADAGDYCKKLNNGLHLNGEIHYLVSNVVGVGVKYSLFTSSTQGDYAIKRNYGYGSNSLLYQATGMKEKQWINYAGPSVIFQQWLDPNRKFQLSEMLSVGYISYRNEARLDPTTLNLPMYYDQIYAYESIYDVLTEGHTWGGTIGVSVEYYLLPCLSVGVNAGLMYALPIEEMDMYTKNTTEPLELSKPDYVKLSRWDYSLNIRLHF